MEGHIFKGPVRCVCLCVCASARRGALQKDFDLDSDCDPKRTLPTLLQGYIQMFNRTKRCSVCLLNILNAWILKPFFSLFNEENVKTITNLHFFSTFSAK